MRKMQKKPRILCLHGFRTSSKILELGIRKSWPKTLLEELDLDFLDAPFPARGKSDVEAVYSPPYYEWFQYKLTLTSLEYTNSELENSLAYIEDYMTKHGPFDGLLGFSQGAVIAALLPDIQAKGIAFADVPKIKFLILISGAKFKEIKLGQHELASSKSPIRCPSLHFIGGEKDFLKKWGITLLESFVNPIIIHHPWGHTVPKLDEKGLEKTLAFIDKIHYQKMDVSLDFRRITSAL